MTIGELRSLGDPVVLGAEKLRLKKELDERTGNLRPSPWR
jgi:hypothetical protein